METIFDIFYSNKDEVRAKQMSAYMRNQFPFLGIGSVKRDEISKQFFLNLDKSQKINWNFVFECFQKPEREFTYLALNYIDKLKSNISEEEFYYFEKLVAIRPWWDSVDSIAPIIGFICRKYNSFVHSYILPWADSDNKWLIRISIIYQLKYKKNTDIGILSKVILKNNNSSEFYIDKAIGWALRQYARTDSVWVCEFVNNNNLSKLSKREALKRIRSK